MCTVQGRPSSASYRNIFMEKSKTFCFNLKQQVKPDTERSRNPSNNQGRVCRHALVASLVQGYLDHIIACGSPIANPKQEKRHW